MLNCECFASELRGPLSLYGVDHGVVTSVGVRIVELIMAAVEACLEEFS